MRIIENTTGLKSHPAGQVIKFSKKGLTRETFKLLKKNLNLLQLKPISTKLRFKNNWDIFTDISNSKSILKILKKGLVLLKKTSLSVKEPKALQELKSRDDTAITNADKGGAVVILHVEDYIKKAERQLRKTVKDRITFQIQSTTKQSTR